VSRIPFAFIAAVCLGAAVCGPAAAADSAATARQALIEPKLQAAPLEARKKSARFDASRCAVPGALVTQPQPLPHVGFKLRNNMPIKIVAIGSSSTQGHGASDPSASYPSRLADELAELWPRAQIAVVNRGVGGERTAQMMARFERDVLAEKPDLVIWQVGTNESLAGDTIYTMRELIIEGVDTIEMAGSDVILMSPQYAPRFNEKPDHLLRVEAVRSAAQSKDIGIFRRFEIMQNWVARENMTVATMITADGLHMNDLSYGCTAHLLARQIAAASRAIPLMAVRGPAAIPASAMAAPPIAVQAVMPPAGPAALPTSPNIPR
jgi:acyl-CoA thioesterase-1